MIEVIEKFFTHRYQAHWTRGNKHGIVTYVSKKPVGSPINRMDAITEINKIWGQPEYDEVTFVSGARKI